MLLLGLLLRVVQTRAALLLLAQHTQMLVVGYQFESLKAQTAASWSRSQEGARLLAAAAVPVVVEANRISAVPPQASRLVWLHLAPKMPSLETAGAA